MRIKYPVKLIYDATVVDSRLIRNQWFKRICLAEDKALAKRIAACLNACQNLSTKELKKRGEFI